MLVLAIEKPSPGALEIVATPIEFPYWLADELIASRSKHRLSRRIGFEADSLVVENQNAIQSAIEDGLVFALRGIERVCGFALFPFGQNEETDVERDGN